MEIALVSESPKVDATTLAFWAVALDRQMIEHFCPAWGLEPWPVSAYSTLPADGKLIHPMFVMDNIGEPNALGFHTSIADFVFSRVLAPDDPNDATTASHESSEERLDPDVGLWWPMPDGRQVAGESDDPVEGDAYPIAATIAGETRTIMVSNFILPAWKDPKATGPFDYLGKLSAPFTMTPGGYMVVMDANGQVSNLYDRSDRLRGRALALKMLDRRSRTFRRHAKFAQTLRGPGVFPPSTLR